MAESVSADQYDATAGNLSSEIRKAVELAGLTEIAKDAGFITKNNEIDKLSSYDASVATASKESADNVRRSKRATKGVNTKYLDSPVTPSTAAAAIPVVKQQSQYQQSTQGHNAQHQAPPASNKRKVPEIYDFDEEDLDAEDEEPATKKPRTAPAAMKIPMASTIINARDDGNKGLRHFSQKVCEKVQSKGSTTYNEVADELVNDLNESGELGQEVDAKNIRRRVYDALNVLMAMKIIEKEKKEIRWKGLPTSDTSRELEMLKRERSHRQDRVQKKKEYLQELEIQSRLYKSLVERNMRNPIEDTAERVQLPFIIIHTKKETAIECEMSEDRTEYFFDFSQPFSIHDDNEILKRMGLLEEPSPKGKNAF